MKKSFSKRYNYREGAEIGLESMPKNLRNRLWNVIRDYIKSSSKKNKLIELIWDRFYKEDKDKLKGTTSYI